MNEIGHGPSIVVQSSGGSLAVWPHSRKVSSTHACWEAREACMKAGASLQLVGTDDMIEAASEAIEFLLGAARGLRATIPPEAQ
jgi:hypothetical protein